MNDELFNLKIKEDNTPAKYNESEISFLNRSTRDIVLKTKEYFNFWFNEFKKEQLLEESSRMREDILSGNDERYYSAITELWIYSFLKKQKFTLKAHPNIKNVRGRPDYLAEKDGGTFYLEVKTIIGSSEDLRVKKTKNHIKNMVDELACIDFYINISFLSIGDDNLKYSLIKKRLKEAIENLDYELIKSKKMDPPIILIEEGGWNIKIDFIPVGENARKKRTVKSRNIGVTFDQLEVVKIDKSIKDAIHNKKKYKGVKKPFLLVINVINKGIFLDDIDIMDALFGNMQYTLKENSNDLKFSRKNNGASVNKKKGVVNKTLVVFGL